jgi:hypothetical protein
MSSTYREISDNLLHYIETQNYRGYDPYDTLNSWLPFEFFGKWGRPVAIQIQKRNPINVRPVIGIKKGYNPKAMGLFLQSYSLMYKNNPSDEVRSKMDFLFNWLRDNRSKGFNHYCWGYNFDWASSVKFLPAYSPTIVVSVFVAKGIIEYHKSTQNPEAIMVLKSIAEFVINDLPQSKDQSGICFSYSTIEKDCCYNASMLGSELMAYLYQVTNMEEYKELAIASAEFVVDKQKEDGRWNYSINLETGKERTQIDFHQGYVIDSLGYIMKYIPSTIDKFERAFLNGLKYYESQFLENGQCLYRVPHKWPVDIHNQAQGIITFTRWAEEKENYLDKAHRIADYTIRHLYSKTGGFFYYKKYPWVTIKTPFIRWGQAWMLLALTEMAISKEGND